MQLVVRAELDVSGADFWVKTPLANGVRYLLAFTALAPAEAFARVRSLVATSDASALDWLEFADAARGEHRLLGRDGAGVALMLYAARERARLPEAGWLADSFAGTTDDWLLLAGCGRRRGRAGRCAPASRWASSRSRVRSAPARTRCARSGRRCAAARTAAPACRN